MSPLPGWEVNITEAPSSPALETDTGNGFYIGKATTPAVGELYSIEQFVPLLGARDAGSPLYDSVDSFFHEGGRHLYVAAGALAAEDAAVIALLDNFDRGLGFGQVAAPGLTTQAVHEAVSGHASDFARVAVLDGPDTETAATLVTAAGHVTGAADKGRFAGMFAPWDIAPGIASGTNRTIPPSGRICGNIARNDAAGISPNEPAAGPKGIAKWVQGVSQTYTDADRQTLNEAGVNVSMIVRRQVRTYGWRSLADQTDDKDWSLFSGSRIIAVIKDRLGIVAEDFEFSMLDSKEHTTKKYAGVIAAELMPYYLNDDLFGETPEEAFSVDTSLGSVNTIDTMAAGELHAKVALRTSPFAERNIIDVAKVPITESLPSA